MNEEQCLYMQQMELWFKEQQRLEEQLERTIRHYEEMAELNRQQLEIHRKRIDIVRVEFDKWLSSLNMQGCGGDEGDE